MGSVKRNCPHCHSKDSSFTAFADSALPNQKHRFLSAFYCGGCHGGIFLELQLHGQNHAPAQYSGNIEGSDHFDLFDQYPIPTDINAPGYLDENLQSFFKQAADNLQSGNFDASSMMSRKTLEVAVKKLNFNGSGNLYPRIEELHATGLITDDLKDWAHIIRDDGNIAAHEEEPVGEKFAEELLSFTELFLMYTFTMPGMVAAKRGISEADNEEN